MAEQEGGAGAKGCFIARAPMGPMHCGKMASERLLSQKECDIIRGTNENGPQREGLVKTQKECDQVKGTHLWRPQRKGHVETWKECKLASLRGTHELGPTGCQDRERVRLIEGHSPQEAADGGYIGPWKKAASRGALTSWGQQSEGGHAKCPGVGILKISRPAKESKVKLDIVASMKSGLLGVQGLARGSLLLAVGSSGES